MLKGVNGPMLTSSDDLRRWREKVDVCDDVVPRWFVEWMPPEVRNVVCFPTSWRYLDGEQEVECLQLWAGV